MIWKVILLAGGIVVGYWLGGLFIFRGISRCWPDFVCGDAEEVGEGCVTRRLNISTSS